MLSVRQKLHKISGLSRLALILVLAILVMLAIILVPMILPYFSQAEDTGCATAMKSAQRKLDNTYILDGEMTEAEAQRAATQAVKDFDDLCPAGGEIYLIRGGTTGYTVVCGLHDPDAHQRSRLNAARTLERVERALLREKTINNNDAPVSLTVTLNSRELVAVRDPLRDGLRYGTDATMDREGTLASYDLENGELVWFNFADENYALTWTADKGWSD